METLQDRLDALTHKLLHQRQGLVGIRAEDVAGGTFGNGVGNYAFPVNVTIAGTLGVTGAATFSSTLGVTGAATFSGIVTVGNYLQTGWIEVRNTTGNAAIDFIRTPGVVDFNTRLINHTDNILALETTSGADTNTGGQFFAGNAWMGSHPVHGVNGWAAFGHKNVRGTGNYGFLQNNAGESLMNAASGRAAKILNNGNIIFQVGGGDVYTAVPFNLGGNKIWTKAYGDDVHRIQHSGGLDSLEFFTWIEHRFVSQGALRGTISNDMWSNGILKGGWGGFAPGLRSRSGGNVCQLQWWSTFEMWVDATLVKTFVIDHPTKPDRHLVHATVEGPEAVVVYRGQAALDKGWVEVRLPDYFEALTKLEGRSVHLTSIADDPADEWCPVLHATYPKNGRFFVGLGSGLVIEDQKFWWEVKAVRKDVSINVEPLKKDVVVMGTGPYSYYREKT